jgi:methionyl-tRNA formyltransferase
VLSTDTLEDMYAKYRAFFLRPKIWFIRQDKKIIVEKLSLDETLFEIHKTTPLLDNGKLNLAVKEIIVKPEGKKAMDWKSFVNGYLK